MNWAKVTDKLKAHEARVAQLLNDLQATRAALQRKNWEDAELTAQGERLHDAMARELEAAETVASKLRAAHDEHWRRRHNELLAEADAGSVVALVKAWKVHHALGGPYQLQTYIEQYLFGAGGPIERALAAATFEGEPIPLDAPETPALDGARDWVRGAYFGT